MRLQGFVPDTNKPAQREPETRFMNRCFGNGSVCDVWEPSLHVLFYWSGDWVCHKGLGFMQLITSFNLLTWRWRMGREIEKDMKKETQVCVMILCMMTVPFINKQYINNKIIKKCINSFLILSSAQTQREWVNFTWPGVLDAHLDEQETEYIWNYSV